jgi:Fe2+ or Zn2+ uptake regulation protein
MHKEEYVSSFAVEVKEILSCRGGRMTPQRRLILEALEANQAEHLTAEELYEKLKSKSPSLHLSTVYRTLRLLEAEGMIGSRWFEKDRGQERFDMGQTVDHHHFVCKRCGQVVEFETPFSQMIEAQFENEYGCTVESISIHLSGLCQNCCRGNQV